MFITNLIYYACIVYCENIVPYNAQTKHVKFDVCFDQNSTFSIQIESSKKYCLTLSN